MYIVFQSQAALKQHQYFSCPFHFFFCCFCAPLTAGHFAWARSPMLTLYTCKLEETAFQYAMLMCLSFNIQLIILTSVYHPVIFPEVCLCVWRGSKSYVWIWLVHDRGIQATKGKCLFSCICDQWISKKKKTCGASGWSPALQGQG